MEIYLDSKIFGMDCERIGLLSFKIQSLGESNDARIIINDEIMIGISGHDSKSDLPIEPIINIRCRDLEKERGFIRGRFGVTFPTSTQVVPGGRSCREKNFPEWRPSTGEDQRWDCCHLNLFLREF